MEVVTEVQIGPPVGVADGAVQGHMQTAQFQDARIARLGFGCAFFADFGDQGRGEMGTVEEIVDVGETQPERAHEAPPVFVVLLADDGQAGVGRLPQVAGEGEVHKALGWRVTQVLF